MGAVLLGIAAIIAACGTVAVQLSGVIDARHARERIEHKVDRVHREVKTANGLTIGQLADSDEGRRILAEILKGDRTESEQHYVDRLTDEPT